MELKCAVQTYDWGKIGSKSEVAQLASESNDCFIVDESQPYSELWMGTHPNGPSHVIERNISLTEYLKNNVDAFGPEPRNLFGNNLSFLFKVLSVRKALSIQAHPNKAHAEVLHAKYPDLYKDDNHKPELAIALTEFKALCGFRPLDEIQSFVNDIPEFRNVLGEGIVQKLLSLQREDQYHETLKETFKTLLLQDKLVIKDNLNKLISRISLTDEHNQQKLHFGTLLRIHNDYPGDVGCWSLYILNFVTLQPGQAIFLGPNLPHAYLEGDCIECMSCSDNVVRAGLTPKFIDVDTLVEMLQYKCQRIEELLFEPDVEDEFTNIWRPPVDDFAVARIVIPKNTNSSYNTIIRASASILIVVRGEATAVDTEERHIKRGSVLFLKACRQLTITISKASPGDLVLYQALTNIQ